MKELSSKERIDRILKRQSVDRIGLYEHFWDDTQEHWVEQGFIKKDEDLIRHFGMDFRMAGWPNLVAVLDFEDEIVEESEEWKLVRDGNGALLRCWKHKSGTPEHVDFVVKDRSGWEEYVRPALIDDRRLRDRIPFEDYRNSRQLAERDKRFFCWSGVNVFECMHPVCGHEYMLMGMALDPDWVKDMCNVYADLILRIQQTLFAEEGRPDGIFFFEDMGFKGKPFMSPEMYKQIVWPAHKKSFDYAHSIGCPVLVHSCGYVEPLIPDLIEAGMDCLQVIEVKAGMDLLRLKERYGNLITLFGGIDIRVLETNDKAKVEQELLSKLPAAMAGGGYILHTDHSVSTRVDYETLKYFQQRGLEIGTY